MPELRRPSLAALLLDVAEPEGCVPPSPATGRRGCYPDSPAPDEDGCYPPAPRRASAWHPRDLARALQQPRPSQTFPSHLSRAPAHMSRGSFKNLSELMGLSGASA
jgi:hypothetical protein